MNSKLLQLIVEYLFELELLKSHDEKLTATRRAVQLLLKERTDYDNDLLRSAELDPASDEDSLRASTPVDPPVDPVDTSE